MNIMKPAPTGNSTRDRGRLTPRPTRAMPLAFPKGAAETAWSKTGHATVHVGTTRNTDRYELNVATAYYDRPDILDAWYRMLGEATGPETLYQSPQFFNYLVDMDSGQEASYELFVIRRRTDYAIVGFVPVRTLGCDLDFRFGSVSLFKRTMRTCQILGSVPLLDPTEQGLVEFVVAQLLARYANCDALYMQAVPEEIGVGLPRCAGVSTHVLNGWRPCHTQPLPDSVEAYLQKFNAKKRYNLSRQIRLLTEAAGPLQVRRIEQPGQVASLLDATIAITGSLSGARDAEQVRLKNLARHGLLLSYVIRCGDEDVAVVLGSRSSSVWHVHKIACKHKYLPLSVGMSAVHLAVMDVLANAPLQLIDYGYGTPNAEFRSTHVLRSRGHVLLHRTRSLSTLLLKVHGKCDALNEAMIRHTKAAKKWYAKRKQASPQALKARRTA
ncbi:GNAT family N-acetyltransferase [Massilia sp. TW-1]|uniref:GNAT family N-acetyltransferase n=1 Tax=Telluria antibiotica TaxID=2717319 RepID=A0ABX0P6Y2_9BURK|nr:GNAT family N-acetyltransferase [Telluria antibiotica]NIA53030.1 GNAT family N-acetyltransferase [Telluria antibiotica]